MSPKLTPVGYGKEVDRREDDQDFQEAIVYEWAGGGYIVLVRVKGGDDLGTKFFPKLKAAIVWAELVLGKDMSGASVRAETWAQRAILYAEGSPLWEPTKAWRPYFAFTFAREAAREAFAARPSLRGEPRRRVPEIASQAVCDCGHALCCHVADRLPCLCDCPCQRFTRLLGCGIPTGSAN